VQVHAVFDETHDPQGPAAFEPGVADPQVEDRGHPVGHGDLAGTGRVATGDEAQSRTPMGAVGVLGPDIDRGDRAREGDPLVGDRLDVAVGVLGPDIDGTMVEPTFQSDSRETPSSAR
jgi:hypothetical protein